MPAPYTPAVMEAQRRDLTSSVVRALLWLAAFCFAAGIFLSATQLLRGLPPTPPVAVGRVTIERASKLQDYLGALLFFIIVPATTLPLFRLDRKSTRLNSQSPMYLVCRLLLEKKKTT